MGMLGIVGTVYSLRKRQGFTRAQMLAYQTRRLRNLVRHAWRRSPFYRQYYADHGLKEADLGDIGVGDLPLTDKELLMEHFDRVVGGSPGNDPAGHPSRGQRRLGVR